MIQWVFRTQVCFSVMVMVIVIVPVIGKRLNPYNCF